MADESINRQFGDLYGELHRLAASALRSQRASHTLQPTALIHEVWLKVSRADSDLKGRGHFLATAARAMRQVLQDHARAHRTDKRGRDAPVLQLDVAVATEEHPADDGGTSSLDLLAFDEALDVLSQLNARQAEIAQLRILGGLTHTEVAAELSLSVRTVQTEWAFARAWLRAKLESE